MNLNLEQIKAVKHGEGPALVLAGPGSGKTHTLTNRIKYLIEHHFINPENILVITFSKASAMEMQNRFNSLCKDNYYPVTFGTFHSVFFQIIYEVYHYNASHIMNLYEKRKYMEQAIINAGMENVAMDFGAKYTEAKGELIDTLIKEVSFYKNINESSFETSETGLNKAEFLKVYKEYRNIQITEKKIDFEDMLLIVRNLFRKDTNILQKYREKYSYIMIDEYQDINDIQYEIVKLLLGDKNNLWVCGDDDQSIYGFRGSRPEIMLSFAKDFKSASIYNLKINYRCGEKIMEVSKAFISENKKRYNKSSSCGNRGRECKFETIGFEDFNKEEEWIVGKILKSRRDTTLALLCRTNMEVSKYAEILYKNNISYEMKERPCNPYNSQIYRDVYNYIKLSGNPEKLNINYFFPIINKPSRFIRRDLINGKYITFEELIEKYKDNIPMINRIKTLKSHLFRLEEMEPYAAISYIRKVIGLDEYYRMQFKTPEKYKEYLESADLLKEKAREFKCFKDMEEYVEGYDDIIGRNIKKIPGKISGESVHIMTYHACKGLEFDTVILPHLNEGTVPHQRAVKESQIEEERRLMYVAMTRAKYNLYITYIKGSEHKKHLPSRFLNGINQKHLQG